MIHGLWTTDPDKVKGEIHQFFSSNFHEKWHVRPKFINRSFMTISDDDRCYLETEFSVDEIKKAIFDCGSEKEHCADGFTFKLLKNQWGEMQSDIMRFVKYFEANRNISKECYSSFITLIPKVKDPLNLGDYRPISLIGCVYKIISKSLTSILNNVIGKVIDEVQ